MKKIRLKGCLLSICFVFSLSYSAFAQPNKEIDSLMNVLKDAAEDTNKVTTLNTLSARLWRTSKYQESKNYAGEALVLATKLNFKRGIAGTHNNIATINGLQGNHKEALENFSTALKIALEIGDKRLALISHNGRGVTYRNMGNYPEALNSHRASLKISEEIGDKSGIAYSYGNLGTIYKNQDNYAEALKAQLASLKIREEIGDKRGLAISHNDLGLIYNRLDNYPDALKNYFISLKFREEMGDKRGIAESYANIGALYKKQGNYSEALKNLVAALKIQEEIGNKQEIAVSYSNIGNVYADQKNYSDALKNYLSSLRIFELLGDNRDIAYPLLRIGSVYFEKQNYPEAKKFLEKSLVFSIKVGHKGWISDTYETLSRLDSAMGNYQQALVHYKLSAIYDDSIFNETSRKQIAQLKEQYESEKKEKEIQQLNNDKQKLENEKQVGALLLKNKQDSLLIVQAEKEKVELENDKVMLENERAQTLNLFNQQQIELLGNEKRLQQLQIEKDKADFAVQKAEADKKQEQLIVLGKEKDIQSLQLKKQKEAKNYFIAGAVLLALLSFFVFRNFQNQRKLNKLYKIYAEKQMAELHLQSLRAQLNPHFMFNSLNAIQELIVMEENEKSQSYLERFAQLLRQLLDNASQPFIPLRKEIGFLDLYLSLEKLRLPDLKYAIEVDPKINAESFVIPNMMLQPYVENALWHGLQHKQGEKKLQLHISRRNGSLHYEIKDNGVGRKKAEELKTLYRKEHRSKGMELLSQRFNLLSQEYGQTIQTKVTDLTENGNATGTLVEINVPVSLSEQNRK